MKKSIYFILFQCLIHGIRAFLLQKATVMSDWLKKEGAILNPKIQIEFLPGLGYGLKTDEVLYAGEEVCQIPAHVCFNSQKIVGGIDPLENIAAQLCHEKQLGDSSFYAPYLDTLPDDVSYMPTLWSEERLASIRGTSIYNDVVGMRNRWNEVNEVKYPKIPKDLYLWSRATIQGRLWLLNPPTSFASEKVVVPIIALIPFVSLANHNERKYCSVSLGNGISSPSSSYVVRAEQKHYPNEKVYLKYGDNMSFQQKLISFGWLDRTPSSVSITPIILPSPSNKEIEIKSRIYSHNSTGMLEIKSEDRKEINSTLRIMESELKISRQEATIILIDLLQTRLNELISVQELGKNAEESFNRKEYYFSDDVDMESDALFIVHLEKHSLVSLLRILKQL